MKDGFYNKFNRLDTKIVEVKNENEKYLDKLHILDKQFKIVCNERDKMKLRI